MKARQLTSMDVTRACSGKLQMACKTKRGGEQNFYLRDADNRTVARITVPKGRNPVPPGTFSSMARQAKVTRKFFAETVKCHKNRAEYLDELKTAGLWH